MTTILVGLTTTKKDQILSKISEIKKFKITQIAYFPTCLTRIERDNFAKELESIPNLEIPHIHLRSDMGDEEIEYYISKFKTKIFNIHPRNSKFGIFKIGDKYKKKVYVENSGGIPTNNELQEYGGVCIDFAHWETGKKYLPELYKNFQTLIQTHTIGCCHISAIRDENEGHLDQHFLKNIQDMDYILKYIRYFPEFASLELENSISEQLEIKKYIEQSL